MSFSHVARHRPSPEPHHRRSWFPCCIVSDRNPSRNVQNWTTKNQGKGAVAIFRSRVHLKLRRSTIGLSLSGDEILKSRTTRGRVRRLFYSVFSTCLTSCLARPLYEALAFQLAFLLLSYAAPNDMSGEQAKNPATGAEQPPHPPIPQYPFTGAPYPPPPGAYTWYYPPPADPNSDPNAPPPAPYVMFPPPGIMYGYPPPPAPPQGMSNNPYSKLLPFYFFTGFI